MRKAFGFIISLFALRLTAWAAQRDQRRLAVAQSEEPGNLTLLSVGLVALAASLGYEK
jgi:hypothetical protein